MRERGDFSGCLAIATVGQKATVGQGLPNILPNSRCVFRCVFNRQNICLIYTGLAQRKILSTVLVGGGGAHVKTRP